MIEALRAAERDGDGAAACEECPVCLEPPEDAVITPCAHTFCRECILGVFGRGALAHCPLCRETVAREQLLTVPRASRFAVNIDDEEHWRTSSKIDALLGDLRNLKPPDAAAAASTDAAVSTGARGGGGAAKATPAKAVVFSQWTSMLDLIGAALRREPALSGFVRLDGAMSAEQRQAALHKFREDPKVKVLLLSLRAGGVGLNLTAAQHVFLMDPWWNPAVEEQAIDRVHRIGQLHPVKVTRFVVRGTVEERILELQERKRRVCRATLEGGEELSKEEARRMRLEDLKLCFA